MSNTINQLNREINRRDALKITGKAQAGPASLPVILASISDRLY